MLVNVCFFNFDSITLASLSLPFCINKAAEWASCHLMPAPVSLVCVSGGGIAAGPAGAEEEGG